MGVVAMRGVITFDPEKQSEEHRQFEEDICKKMMPYARGLARKRARYNKWSLNEDELYLEFCAAIARTIEHYAHGVAKDELIALCHTGMKNRYQDVLHKVTKTYRNVESTAHTLKEDIGFGEDIEMGYTSSDFVNDFVNDLSPLAKRLVRLSLEPDEMMTEKIGKYIEYRNTRYRYGAGVSKVPLKLFAEVTNESIERVKIASEEINNKLAEVNMSVAMDTETLLSTLQYTERIITAFESTRKYVNWRNDDIYDQAAYRHIDTEGLRRGEVAGLLHEFDVKHNLPTQYQLDEEREIDKTLTIDDLEPSVSSPPLERPKTEIKADNDDDDDFDDSYWENKKNKTKTGAKTETSEELSKFFEDDKKGPEDDDDDEVIEEAEEESVPVPATKTKAETSSSQAGYQSERSILHDAMQEMNLGSTLIITRIGENEWHGKIVEPQRTGIIRADALMQLFEVRGATIPTEDVLGLADPPAPIAEKIAEKTSKKKSKVKEKGTSPKAANALKKGSEEWRQLLYKPEYLKLQASLKELDVDALTKKAKEMGGEWKDNVKLSILRMNISRSIYKVSGFVGNSRYKKQFRDKSARDAMTL